MKKQTSPEVAILDEDGNVMPSKLMEWANWLERNSQQRIIEQTEIGAYFVSTVFLGFNHQFFPDGPPLWFETMVFGPVRGDNLWMQRCTTLAQAKEMHRDGCVWLRANVLING